MESEEEAALNHSDQESEEYIDMEVSSSSSSNLLCYSSTSSPPETSEFEFQMASSFHHEIPQTSSSPADELFYNGKLLPLYLPPRLQMLQTLLQAEQETEQIITCTPLQSSSSSSSINESSSPTESCRESSELNPDEQQLFSLIHGSLPNPKKNSWSNKLKNQIKQSSFLVQKLKASRVYLKSLFNKSPFCSDGPDFAKETCNVLSSKYMKRGRKNPIGKIDLNHRRSFSGVIQRGSECCSSSTTATSSSSGCSSLSSSFSFSSNNGFYDLQFLKRSGSANLVETETSIEGAIAYCKQSQSSINQQPKLFFSADRNRINFVGSNSERGR